MTKKINFKKILYKDLNARQKENFNFLKASAILADYGFNTIRLSDDWQGADFIAVHINGSNFLKVQLKGDFCFSKKYIGKNIWICFPYQANWYLYPHDKMFKIIEDNCNFTGSVSWSRGGYSWPHLSRDKIAILSKYKI